MINEDYFHLRGITKKNHRKSRLKNPWISKEDVLKKQDPNMELSLSVEPKAVFSGELPDLKQYGKLKRLKILNGQYKRLPDSLFNYLELEEIYIHNDLPITIPNRIKELSNLRELIVYSIIEHLPEEIGDLTKLEALDLGSYLFLSSNEKTIKSIEQLPESIGNLVNLRFLKVNAHLTSLPDSLKNLTKLEILNLNGNNLSELPSYYDDSELREEYPNLSFKEIFDKIPKSKQPLLKKLSIENNNFKTLPLSLCELLIRNSKKDFNIKRSVFVSVDNNDRAREQYINYEDNEFLELYSRLVGSTVLLNSQYLADQRRIIRIEDFENFRNKQYLQEGLSKHDLITLELLIKYSSKNMSLKKAVKLMQKKGLTPLGLVEQRLRKEKKPYAKERLELLYSIMSDHYGR